MTLRQTSILVTWNDDERPELLDGEEWAYTLRLGGVDVEHAVVGEDLPQPAGCTVEQVIPSALAWADRQ